MGVIWGEYDGYIARFACLQRIQVRTRLHLRVLRKGLHRSVQTMINIPDIALEMLADGGELPAVHATEKQSSYFAPSPQIHHHQRHHSRALVRARGLPSHKTSRILPRPDHQHCHRLRHIKSIAISYTYVSLYRGRKAEMLTVEVVLDGFLPLKGSLVRVPSFSS